ncbi:methyltransferase [Myxococcota bacterium]|nr:methyltransferase [Myxococcota bacterium]
MTASWPRAKVAPEGTHHLLDGVPLYPARFRRVWKYHVPGLAPVSADDGAFHIDEHGLAAYPARHLQVFGFYEGRAAVAGVSGWHHVLPGGRALYPERYAWCGNYQEGRSAVRAGDGGYLHLDETGAPVSAARWRYAGDYRDGVAVVQGEDGWSTHVDRAGRMVHRRWFLDLDVYHKGFARARDASGWTHVDATGAPAYPRRFAAVEPFYNGQSRVERWDGGMEVIDERGETVVELRGALRSGLQAASGELVAWWRSEAATAAVSLGLFERLPLEDRTMGDGVLAERLRTLLAALAETGLVDRVGDEWRATESGDHLRREHPSSLAEACRYWATDGRAPWRDLDRALRDPDWHAADPFADMARDPGRVAAYHHAISPYAAHDYAAVPAVLEPGHRRLIDAGGGTGALAASITRALPGCDVTVLERPEVAALGRGGALGGDRACFVEADLFAPWPVRGDGIVLARVLHDWEDDRAATVLRNAARALDAGGRIYVVELVRPERGFSGSLLGLHMMLATGGRERTRAEFDRLFRAAGLRIAEARPLPGICTVLVGVPA